MTSRDNARRNLEAVTTGASVALAAVEGVRIRRIDFLTV